MRQQTDFNQHRTKPVTVNYVHLFNTNTYLMTVFKTKYQLTSTDTSPVLQQYYVNKSMQHSVLVVVMQFSYLFTFKYLKCLKIIILLTNPWFYWDCELILCWVELIFDFCWVDFHRRRSQHQLGKQQKKSQEIDPNEKKKMKHCRDTTQMNDRK